MPLFFALFSPHPFCPELHAGLVGVAVVAGTQVGAVAGTLPPKKMAFGNSQIVQVVVELEQLFAAVGVDQTARFGVVALASCGGCRAISCDWNCLNYIVVQFMYFYKFILNEC